MSGPDRSSIDAEFQAMADDPDYQKDALRSADEFRFSDWEALRLGDRARILDLGQ